MNEKADPGLLLGKELTLGELVQTGELKVGYDSLEDRWEVIVRFSGEISPVMEKYPDITYHQLKNQYALLEIPAYQIDFLGKEPSIIYMEKPKQLYHEKRTWHRQYNQITGQRPMQQLTGKGVLVAIIDTGINLEEQQFRNEDGSTRVVALIDQMTGHSYEKSQIDELLQSESTMRLPGHDYQNHGNDVAAIAAGINGVAPESNLVIVRMGNSLHQSFPRTTNLMRAVDDSIKIGEKLQMPLAINLSFGNNYGSHDGDSLMETYLNSAAQLEHTIICVGSGNEGLGNTHGEGILTSNSEQTVELIISSYEISINLQVWFNAYDEVELNLISPGGNVVAAIMESSVSHKFYYKNMIIYGIYGEPSPFSMQREIYMEFLAKSTTYLEEGIWKIRMIGGRIKDGKYDLYLPAISTLNKGSGFSKAASNRTCTIPSTAKNVVSVGAYDQRDNRVAPFSGRGYSGRINGSAVSKPDLIAPGVNVKLPNGNLVSGTSYATPYVTGRAALLMEQGIVRGEDPYLYGAKLKARLIAQTEPLMGYTQYPSSQVGWGKLV